MNELIFIVEEDIDGGYCASALGVSIFTQGDTIEELKTNIKDALKCHFDNEKDIPGYKASQVKLYKLLLRQLNTLKLSLSGLTGQSSTA